MIVEIDIGDENNTRARISANKVELLESGSEILFTRSRNSKPFPFPAKNGDLNLLKQRLGNIHATDQMLLIAWLTYTLAHPKAPTTVYVILVLIGGQGTGKTVLCKIINALISPSLVDVQVMPKNQKDLAVIARELHALIIDNLRKLSQQQSDDLCVFSTGGYISFRLLYSDGEQFVIPLHAALVLNGIHPFIIEPDLAQRCLTLNLNPMDESQRVSERELQAGLEIDLPVIFRGLLDLIAQIFVHLPDAEVTNPERMLDFVTWLAAMEKVDGAPSGAYQTVYSDNLKQGQLESVLDDPLAEAIITFAENIKTEWQGEPKQLLMELSDISSRYVQRSSDWPKTATALSRRARSLQAGLKAHGIYITFGRGQKRWIKIETDKTESRF